MDAPSTDKQERKEFLCKFETSRDLSLPNEVDFVYPVTSFSTTPKLPYIKLSGRVEKVGLLSFVKPEVLNRSLSEGALYFVLSRFHL